ncbi:MAG: MotA/TolQ/ExbB proton channel family protein [Bdellovibrionota bacterium]|nr:MotA/TolQ/ExbB proton channel family protein [Bdellovibrionota bacterium]
MKKTILTTAIFLLSANLLAEDSLLKTYQRELAFLTAQKRTLEKQKTTIEKQFVSKVAKAKRDLDKAQNDLVKLTKTNELKSTQLLEAERNLENIEGSNSLLETTLLQGKMTLNFDEEKWKSLETGEAKISAILSGAVKLLTKGGEIEMIDGEFFTQEGKLTEGRMIKVGRIASYGITPKHSSMLMPVGLGKLKLTENNLEKELAKFRSGDLLTSMPIFLYETTSKGIEPKKEKTFMEIVEAGGAIAYVIVGLGLVALFLALIRGFLLYKASQFDKGILAHIQKGDLKLVEEQSLSGNTPFDRVLLKTFLSKDKEREARENVIHESILGELNYLDKFGAIILVMAAVAPLLGLLGTVTGMISTFDIITEFGTGDPKLLSSGISEALITTKLGLVVAIPSLLLGNLLGGWSGKIKVMLEREALRLSNLFDKEQGSEV